MTLLYLVLNRGGPRLSVPSAAGAAHEDIDLMRIDNQKTKMEFTAALSKVIQWLVDDEKMNRCHTELQATLAAVDKLEETHDLLFLLMRVNETAAVLKLVKSVQQSVSDCHSAKVILFHDPGSSFHLLQTSHSSLLLEFQNMVEIQVLNQKRRTA
jgi:hypothetical protein